MTTRCVWSERDPDREGLLYAGTEFGMFISFDDGVRWQPFQLDLPVTPVTDIKIVEQDLVLSTMGRGFWILDDLTPLYEVSVAVAEADAHLFAVRDAYRRPTVGFGSGPAAPQYSPVGAYIDYTLREEVETVRLDILDPTGVVIRTFSNTVPDEDETLPECCDWRLEAASTARLPAEAGAHRFVWDLRLPGPWRPGRPSRDDAGRGCPRDATKRV